MSEEIKNKGGIFTPDYGKLMREISASEDYRALLLGNFVPDEREIALHERLVKYYKDTPDSMSNRDALPHWKLFTEWCFNNGYTREEINNAKKQCARLDI